MNRTFTLQRLLLNVVLFSAFAGFVAAFPILAVRVALAVSLFLPAFAISVAFAYFSRHPTTVFAISLLGAGIGWLFSPVMLVSWAGPPTWWDIYLVDLQTQLLPALLGAVFFGGIALAVFRAQARRRPTTVAPDHRNA